MELLRCAVRAQCGGNEIPCLSFLFAERRSSGKQSAENVSVMRDEECA